MPLLQSDTGVEYGNVDFSFFAGSPLGGVLHVIIFFVRRADGVAQSSVDLRYYVIRDVIVI